MWNIFRARFVYVPSWNVVGSIPGIFFKALLVCFLTYMQCIPQIRLWCDTCWPLDEAWQLNLLDPHTCTNMQALVVLGYRGKYGKRGFRSQTVFTACKQSLRRLCFYICLLVILFTGGVSALVHTWIHPLGADTPPGQTPPLEQTPHGQSPPPRAQCMQGDTGNKRAVRILLECILVIIKFDREINLSLTFTDNIPTILPLSGWPKTKDGWHFIMVSVTV